MVLGLGKYVVIRDSRVCGHCGGTLPKGTKCYTVSTRAKGRVWYCSSCSRALLHRDYLLSVGGTVDFNFADSFDEVNTYLHNTKGSKVGTSVR